MKNTYKPATGPVTLPVLQGLAERLGIPTHQAGQVVRRPSFDAYKRMCERHNEKARLTFLDKYANTSARERPDFIRPFDIDRLGGRFNDALDSHSVK